MKYEIWFSPTARAEIIEAFEYIRNDQHAPLNAARWLDGIIDAISNLSDARTRIHRPERTKSSRKIFANAFTIRTALCLMWLALRFASIVLYILRSGVLMMDRSEANKGLPQSYNTIIFASGIIDRGRGHGLLPLFQIWQ